MSIAYRPATPGDIDGIVTVFLDCWRGSYRAVLPAHLIDAMTDAQAHALWTRVLAEAAPGEMLVAERDADAMADTAAESDAGVAPGVSDASGATAVLGAAAPQIIGVTRFVAGPDGHGAVHSLYVSPLAQGTGIGSHLLRAAGDALAEAGMTTAGLWVFRDNAPSLAFYQRQDWTPTGETRVQAEFGEPELGLARQLTAAANSGSVS
ncbi:GNAT family N-acetyltransferase [Cryobacterium sp. Y11]|uniref:GNAT family N-acetyltransferase n=1 Tax=Cryobacterium sp. Y11 TaxID=2045016 RepID=UPI000CE54728|nr:GNAT family N-acetyltransferase [Cryobacterium sp. Y11]